MADPFIHRVRPRYSEIDMQRVVFKAHYLTYCDDAAGLWFKAMGAGLEDDWWDVVVKKATITWEASARVHDDLTIAVAVSRWGATSFDVRFTGTVEGAPIFDAELTYIAVRTSTSETVRVPDDFRTAAGGPRLT